MIVYKATNLINQDSYVGITKRSLDKRKWEHFHNSKKENPTYFSKAIKKYGLENFEFKILDKIEPNETYKDLLDLECLYIGLIRPKYNLTKGGEGTSGLIFSEEHKKNLTMARRNRPGHSLETKKRMSASQKGRVISESTKEKLRVINIGRKHSENAKLKISQAKVGVPGHKHTDDAKFKIGIVRKGIPRSIETKSKISNTKKGKPFNKPLDFSEAVKRGWTTRRLNIKKTLI